MTATDIRETIVAALRYEKDTGDFEQKLALLIPGLRERLVLPEQDPASALMAFITDYVESVPGCLSLVTAISKQLGFHEYAAPFLHMAEDYFLQPPEGIPGDGGLEAILDEAFLAHRLLEEVNDHHIRHLSRPLLPLDMTEANLIVHHLLGDEFATRLEHLVQFTASHPLEQEHVWEQVRSLPGAEASFEPQICSDELTDTSP